MAYEKVQKPSSRVVPVQKKVSGFTPSASRVQAKDVTAGEQEQMPLGSTPATDANWLMKHPLLKGNQFLQRVVAPASESESLESEESLAQRETIQRQEEGKESGALQAKPVRRTRNRQEETETPNPTGLPDELKAGVENLSGYTLDDVRVHYNSHKPAQLKALAYTQGTEIHVAPGQEEHLPHEVWHVVQQKQGRVKPTMQMKGVQINDDEGLEKEADVMGAKAATTPQKAGLPLQAMPLQQGGEAPVQGMFEEIYELAAQNAIPITIAIVVATTYGIVQTVNFIKNCIRRGRDVNQELTAVSNGEKSIEQNHAEANVVNEIDSTKQERITEKEKYATTREKSEDKSVIESPKTESIKEEEKYATKPGKEEEENERDSKNEDRSAEVEKDGTLPGEKKRLSASEVSEFQQRRRSLASQSKLVKKDKDALALLHKVIDAEAMTVNEMMWLENYFNDVSKETYWNKGLFTDDSSMESTEKAEDVFAKQYPKAIRIRPYDSIKEKLEKTPFADVLSFVSSTFHAVSPTLPRFDGHPVYHDTKGGGSGGFTIFGVKVGDDKFLIAHGRHNKDGGYKLEWVCDPKVPEWDNGSVKFHKK